MTSEANYGLPSVDRRAFVVPLEPTRARAFRKAYSHSRNVRLLRLALPAAALGVIAFYMLTSNISITIGDTQASIDRIELDRDALRMVNPKMKGATGDNGTYQVTAAYAEQEVATPSTMRLNEIRAETVDGKQAWSRLEAPKGTFYTKEEKLDLFGGIEVTTSNGLAATLKTATVDMKTQIVRSHDPVVVRLLNGTVHANTMEMKIDERRVLFRDKVRVHVRKRPVEKPVDTQ